MLSTGNYSYLQPFPHHCVSQQVVQDLTDSQDSTDHHPDFEGQIAVYDGSDVILLPSFDEWVEYRSKNWEAVMADMLEKANEFTEDPRVRMVILTKLHSKDFEKNPADFMNNWEQKRKNGWDTNYQEVAFQFFQKYFTSNTSEGKKASEGLSFDRWMEYKSNHREEVETWLAQNKG